MLRRIKDRLGTAGLIVALFAVVLAVGGTALAASGALTGKQKKEVEKIAKKFAGKPGAPGAAGTNGTNGKDGAPGAAGTNGINGKNAEAIPFSGSKGPIGGVTCTEGGLEVKSAGATTLVCNGVKGTNGTTGFTETLPPGQTETGTIASRGLSATYLQISFSIPLSAALDGSHVKRINLGDSVPAECAGGSAATPKAAPGYLCLYNTPFSELFEAETEAKLLGITDVVTGSAGVGTTGGVVSTEAHEAFDTIGATYAVTAPAAP